MYYCFGNELGRCCSSRSLGSSPVNPCVNLFAITTYLEVPCNAQSSRSPWSGSSNEGTVKSLSVYNAFRTRARPLPKANHIPYSCHALDGASNMPKWKINSPLSSRISGRVLWLRMGNCRLRQLIIFSPTRQVIIEHRGDLTGLTSNYSGCAFQGRISAGKSILECLLKLWAFRFGPDIRKTNDRW